ncbi:MAG: hypothetical protein AAF909_10750 [Pseudomonadota bacterium]
MSSGHTQPRERSAFSAPFPRAAARPHPKRARRVWPAYLRGRRTSGAPLFGRDFWPRRQAAPMRRVALAMLAAPLVPLALTIVLGGALYFLTEPIIEAWRMTWRTAWSLASTLYLPLATGAGIAFATLWALRLRSRRAFATAGATLGLCAAIVLFFLDREAATPVIIGYAVLSGALTLLAARSLAGVRARRAG